MHSNLAIEWNMSFKHEYKWGEERCEILVEVFEWKNVWIYKLLSSIFEDFKLKNWRGKTIVFDFF